MMLFVGATRGDCFMRWAYRTPCTCKLEVHYLLSTNIYKFRVKSFIPHHSYYEHLSTFARHAWIPIEHEYSPGGETPPFTLGV